MIQVKHLCSVAKQAILSSIILCTVLLSCLAHPAAAQTDEMDPFERLFGSQRFQEEEIIPDEDKSAEELLADANVLLQDGRLLDGRTKLLSALKKDPKSYRVMMVLAGYYMQYVGHHRLALRYVSRALELFYEKNGRPPYDHIMSSFEHQKLLYLLSTARLNLDDYQGSLDVLDEFTSYGYTDDWYAASRAWVLMKLGRVDEAIKISRAAALLSSERGRILNMLGILLSIENQRVESLEIFRQAIAYEFSLGRDGQPGTPLNNSAEVLKEMFEEERAITAWLRTIRLPDGCDHILPALNLSLLAVEGSDYKQASSALDAFEECNAQFPLRNGEEHRGLLALARGRIALRQGDVATANVQFQEAQRQRQWFGKIGTDENDMRAGVLQSLSQGARARAYDLQNTPDDINDSWVVQRAKRLQRWAVAQTERIKSAWYARQAVKLLGGTLRDFEDLEVRFTDSMLEYSTLGDLTEAIPPKILQDKVAAIEQHDDRSQARAYYLGYLAQSQLAHGQEEAGVETLGRALLSARPAADKALITHLLLLKLRHTDDANLYRTIALKVFRASPGWFRNAGMSLPVRAGTQLTERQQAVFESAGFSFDTQSTIVVEGYEDGSVSLLDDANNRVVSAKSVEELINKVFRVAKE